MDYSLTADLLSAITVSEITDYEVRFSSEEIAAHLMSRCNTQFADPVLHVQISERNGLSMTMTHEGDRKVCIGIPLNEAERKEITACLKASVKEQEEQLGLPFSHEELKNIRKYAAKHDTAGFSFLGDVITNPWVDLTGNLKLNDAQAIAEYGKENLIHFCREAQKEIKKTKNDIER